MMEHHGGLRIVSQPFFVERFLGCFPKRSKLCYASGFIRGYNPTCNLKPLQILCAVHIGEPESIDFHFYSLVLVRAPKNIQKSPPPPSATRLLPEIFIVLQHPSEQQRVQVVDASDLPSFHLQVPWCCSKKMKGIP